MINVDIQSTIANVFVNIARTFGSLSSTNERTKTKSNKKVFFFFRFKYLGPVFGHSQVLVLRLK